MSHRLRACKPLASVLTSREPVHACSVAALLTTTAVVDTAVNNTIAITLAPEQVVARCVTDLCWTSSQNGYIKHKRGRGDCIPVARSLGLAAAKPIRVTATETMAEKRILAELELLFS